jgi:transcriptional regulator with XRE-family HTH domain
MTITEKLRVLTEDRIKSVLCRRAGLPPTAISDYIAKNQIPRADKALKLARVLQVDLAWLLDDTRGLPVIHANYPDAKTPHKKAA